MPHRSRKRPEKHKEMGYAYAGGKCISCGDSDIKNLTFHHRNPKEKKWDIGSSWDRSWPSLKRELDKCDLLCKGCHKQIESITYPHRVDYKIRRMQAIQYLGGKCSICGDSVPDNLKFHTSSDETTVREEGRYWNKRLKEKEGHPSHDWENIQKKLDETTLLCYKCHKKVHEENSA